MLKVYIQVDSNNRVISYNLIENPLSDDIEVVLEVDDIREMGDLFTYVLKDGQLVQDLEYLVKVKEEAAKPRISEMEKLQNQIAQVNNDNADLLLMLVEGGIL